MMKRQKISSLILAICFSICDAHAQRATGPVTLTITTTSHGNAIPIDFSGLSVETSTIMNGNNGISGNLFSPTQNTEMITLFQNLGLKNLRVGGGTVDQNYSPSCADIDSLFGFAPLAGVKVIYSLRLLNSISLPNSCGYLGDTSDKGTAAYIFSKGYQSSLSSFSIGNEPDFHSYHTYCTASGCTCTYPTGCTGDPTNLHTNDPLIYETAAIGDRTTAGTAYQAYKADWGNFATGVAGAANGATFSGPDTGAYDTLTYYNGTSWTQNFANDEKSSGFFTAALQHNYTGHSPTVSCDGDDFALTTQNAIDDMLSPNWVTGTAITTQPYAPDNTCGTNGTNGLVFTPYPWLYTNNLAPVVTAGVPYRLTESNDILTGVDGASNGYAAALWVLDYMNWWAAHSAAGVNFHNKQWIFTDTIVPNPNPCNATCGNYQTTPKGYGMKAFDLGGHGYVEPITVAFPSGSFNLTAYAVGDGLDTYVTIINKTHLSTNDIEDAVVTIQPNGFTAASASWMALSNGDPGNASSLNATLGGASILNNARWAGTWTPLPPDTNGSVTLTVPSTSAAVVKIHAASLYSGSIQMNQNGALEMFGTDVSGNLWHSWQKAANVPNSPLTNWSSWSELTGISSLGGVAVAKNENNTLEAFVPTSGNVFHIWQLTPGGAWSSWTDMGSGRGVADLRVGNNADGSLSVFGIGSNGDVWYASQNAPGVGWSAWTDLSGQQIQPGFVVGQNLNGNLEVFGVDNAGNVWYNVQASSVTWGGWNNGLGGKSLNPQLAIARNLDGRLEIFGADGAGNVWHNWQTSPGGSWNGWSEITGMQLKPGFVVGQNKDGRLVLFGVATTAPNDVWNIWQQGSPGGNFGGNWTDMGGSGMDPHLVVSSTADSRMQLFGVSSSSPYDVWSNWQPTGSSWNGWTDFGASGMRFYAGQP